jgi:hypothetical protein
MPEASVGLVIEIATPHHKDRHGESLAPPSLSIVGFVGKLRVLAATRQRTIHETDFYRRLM